MNTEQRNPALTVSASALQSSSGRADPDASAGSSAGFPTRASTQELVIEAGRLERHYWRDLWRYRELFRVLAWRDVSVRYKQTVIGAAWALIRPFLTRSA